MGTTAGWRKEVNWGRTGRRMEVWDSRADGGARGRGSSQDECPSESIYSPPHHGPLYRGLITTTTLLPFPLSSYPGSHLALNHVTSNLYSGSDITGYTPFISMKAIDAASCYI